MAKLQIMDYEIYLAALTPPGTIVAAVEAYQDILRREHELLSAISLSPVIPLKYYLAPPDPPDSKFRLSEPISLSEITVFRKNLYIGISGHRQIEDIAGSLFRAEPEQTIHPLFPLFPGLFVSRFPDGTTPPVFSPPPNALSSSSFHLTLYRYRASDKTGSHERWWNYMEEAVIWQRPVRKPASTGKR